MSEHQSRAFRWRRASLMLGVIALAAASWAVPARARVGVFFGFPLWVPGPFYYPPPLYYPPPVYYAPPPPIYYTPPLATYMPPVGPGPSGTAAARSCYAGAYVCPLEVRIAPGATCWCPDNRGGRAYGRAG